MARNKPRRLGGFEMNITEKYFKALGLAEFYDAQWNFIGADGDLYNTFPNITQHYPDFKKWVLEKMEGDGYEFTLNGGMIGWIGDRSFSHIKGVKDNEILLAAVIAATRYWKGKNE
jgi:hypothetical protein